MAAIIMEQMERTTPGANWIMLEDRAAQLRQDLHPYRPERMGKLTSHSSTPDFYALFCRLIAYAQRLDPHPDHRC